MIGHARFFAHIDVGSHVRVYYRGADCGEAVIIAKLNPATDQILRFKYLNPKIAYPYDSINKHRRGYRLVSLLTPLDTPKS